MMKNSTSYNDKFTTEKRENEDVVSGSFAKQQRPNAVVNSVHYQELDEIMPVSMFKDQVKMTRAA
jgi:hypothetical protein